MPTASPATAEHRRLAERMWHGVPPWRRWGCYVADRAWGTVREDYSADGDAWRFLTHDMSRSRAYRWGEYAKGDTDDICVRIEAVNRGPDAAALHLLPHLWFRNTWAWNKVRTLEPTIIVEAAAAADGSIVLVADDRRAAHLPNLTFQYELGERRLYAPAGGQPLFTDNESNSVRLYGPHAR